jgi:hypothetical protein
MSRREPKGKKVRPTFFVFCEGETEEAYIKYLRSAYRLPIEIDPKIAGNRITGKYIAGYKKQKSIHPNDKTFLIYDCDVEVVLRKLQEIKGAHLLGSNPCFELWYLLHFQNQTAGLTSEECLSKLINHVRSYKKGVFDDKLKNKIIENKSQSILRAKALTELSNPSTAVYKLIEELDAIKNQENC